MLNQEAKNGGKSAYGAELTDVLVLGEIEWSGSGQHYSCSPACAGRE